MRGVEKRRLEAGRAAGQRNEVAAAFWPVIGQGDVSIGKVCVAKLKNASWILRIRGCALETAPGGARPKSLPAARETHDAAFRMRMQDVK